MDDAGFAEDVVALAQKLHFPIISGPIITTAKWDHTGDMIIDTYDAFIRKEEVKKTLKPEIIIRFGAMPVSKAFDLLFKRKSSSYANCG